MRRIYLAARYDRREEMAGYAEELGARGYQVVSRWINGGHEGENASPVEKARWAIEDVEDVMSADCIILFTENPYDPPNNPGRGGRHVEFGMGLATGKRLIVVGYRENIFQWLPNVEFYESWNDLVSKAL